MNLIEYSSSVVLTLLVGGMEISRSHVGSNSVVISEPVAAHKTTDARIIVTVDGVRREKHVLLPHGIAEGGGRVAYY